MNTNSAGPRPEIRGSSRPFRSLLVATAAAFVLMGFIVPKADAVIVSYFNFEDAPAPPPATGPCATVDCTPDKTVNDPGDEGVAGNPGGGIEPSTSNLTITGNTITSTPGLLANRTPGDSDTADPGLALNLSASGAGPATISFTVDVEHYAGLSLSFATNNNGNGYGTVTLGWSFTGGSGSLTQAMPTAGTQIVTFDLSATNVNGDGFTPKLVTFTLTFTNGHSNGKDLQTVIYNILLGGFVVPEPATVWGGLLGVCALCWHQRRRLIGFLPLPRV